ncbi:hypothetical protein [Pseudoalteromonas maricaloris]|uniref:hypothetical protein n=1 Tax=Pseudoalteromonas maricaloris TaxID=184924 RepID=UPI00031BD41B|nr:hypothetical protein [Pseudoalteromonas flavipulchra]
MIERAEELKRPFSELIDRFGYADKFEGYPPENSYIWLVHEHNIFGLVHISVKMILIGFQIVVLNGKRIINDV